jgi:hypothetical protein
MRIRRKIILGVLLSLGVAAFHVLYILREPMIGQAVRDAIVHAAKSISPVMFLCACIITAHGTVILLSFIFWMFDQLPYFKARRLADRRQRDAEEIDRWKIRYATKAAECEAAVKWRAQAEPILAAMRNANRNQNAQAGQVLKR